MNTKKVKWVKKCEETLRTGGRSDKTIRNYNYAIKRFLNYYSNNTKINNLSIDEIIKYFKKNYIAENTSANTYNQSISN